MASGELSLYRRLMRPLKVDSRPKPRGSDTLSPDCVATPASAVARAVNLASGKPVGELEGGRGGGEAARRVASKRNSCLSALGNLDNLIDHMQV